LRQQTASIHEICQLVNIGWHGLASDGPRP